MLGTTNLFDANDKFVIEISMMDAYEMVEAGRAKWKYRRRHGRAWKRVGVQMLPPPPPPSDSTPTPTSISGGSSHHPGSGGEMFTFAAASADQDHNTRTLMGYERRTMARVEAWPQTTRGLECKAPTIVAGSVAGPEPSEIAVSLARDASFRFSL